MLLVGLVFFLFLYYRHYIGVIVVPMGLLGLMYVMSISSYVTLAEVSSSYVVLSLSNWKVMDC